MNYRRLGRSGIKVSEIALGSWLTYGTVTAAETAQACVKTAYDLGVNHFDCANVYGGTPHEAEDMLGKALSAFSRPTYVLTTKAFWPVGDGPNQRGLSRKHIMEEVETSLRTLNTDYIDIFYCHRYDPETEMDEVLRTMDDLVSQGKILYGGVSEWPAAKIAEALSVESRLNLRKIRASQPVYNMFNRYIEDSVLPICEDNGLGLVVFSPLAQGLLTGKYRKGRPIPQGSRAATPEVQAFVKRYLTDELLGKIDLLDDVARDYNLTLSQLALAWVLRLPAIASALIGASRPEQIEENIKAVGVTLNEEALTRIETILA